MDAALRKHCQTRKAAMLAVRDMYTAEWKQVADYIDPWAGQYLYNTVTGPKKLPSRHKVINNKATQSLKTMDAGFMSGHTSKSRPWFILSIQNPQLKELPEVKAWLDDVSQRMRDVLANSNFYTELPRFYHQRHMFGVALLASDEDKESVVRYYSRMIGTYAIALDDRGLVDSFWYSFQMTARNIVQRYPAAGIPRRVTEAMASNRMDEIFTVESLVEPNPDKREGMQGVLYRPYRQIYWIQGTEATDGHGCLEMGGHYELPAHGSRWDAASGVVYSTSPALDSLGDVKQLQYLEGEKLRIIDQMSKPTLAVPSSLRGQGVGLNPGERIYMTPSQTQQEVRPVYTPDARGLAEVKGEIREIEKRVEQGFYADLFRMLDFLDDRQRTAYEISERKEEKISQLGPALESLTDEVLDPEITRLYSIMERNGLIPPLPQVLEGNEIKIEYTSVLAMAQKATGLGTIERTVQFVAGLLAINPNDTSILDKLDMDQAVDEFHDRNGGPARIIRGDDEVSKLRDAAAKQQQMQQMAQMAGPMKDGAQALKTLKEAMPEGTSLAGAMGAG